MPDLKAFEFLAGGGEMGERMRAFDWTSTPLGRAEQWPQSLKTIVRVMLDSRYAMWMLWGPELTFFCNDAYLPTVGMKREWVLGARSDKVWEEIWPEISPRIQRVLNDGQATWDDGLPLFLERYGYPEETHHTFSYSPIYDDGNRIAGMLCVVTEVTDRVIGERRLRVLRDLATSPRAESTGEAYHRLVEVLAHSPSDVSFAALYLLDSKQERFYLRESFGDIPASMRPPHIDLTDRSSLWPILEAVGSGRPELVDLSLIGSASIGAPLWPDKVRQAIVLPIRQGAASSTAVLIAGVSSRRPLDDAYRGFFDLIVRQFAAAIADAQAYEAERARADGLAEIDRAKTTFFSNVSHEFRTPLTLLLGPLEEALGQPGSGLTGEALESAHRNALRLLKLVNSLLDFSRIEAGRVQARFAPVDLVAVTEELTSVFRSAMIRAGLQYTVTCTPLRERVYVDREMWEKIVLNLLSNAFKCTLEGEVRIELRARDEWAELVVTDTGTGIPDDALPHLFERFYRVPGARGRTHEGSGIGLSLVRELVKLHGGSIAADSQVGQGSVFRVRIPFGSAHLPSSQVVESRDGLPSAAAGTQAFVEEAQRWLPEFATLDQSGLFRAIAHAEPATGSAVASSRPMVLLADDNRDMRGYVARLLNPRFAVTAVEDGQAALELIEAGLQPDLVLTDIMMPRLDGYELLKALRSRPQTETTPVILLSARAGEQSRVEEAEVVADDYLIKPFTARELIARIDAQIRLSRTRRAAESELREADRRKDVFLATLAHELRNPMAPIRNAAQMLGSSKLGAEQLKWAQSVIQRQVRHMAGLLDDLLDVARITQGKLELKREFTALYGVVESAVEAVRPLLDSKEQLFSLKLPPNNLTLDADPLRLSQALSNLLTNAAKYTDAGGHISLSGHVEGETLVLAVKDDGIGIAPESLNDIFVMFSQIQSAASRSEGGIGLGLSLVNALVTLHGGTVEAKSAGLGKGSEFILRLPILVAQPIAVSIAPRTEPATLARRLLVADDNQDAADSLAMILELAGYEVMVVHDGRSALSVAQRFQPEVMLLDIGMPQLNGYEVAEATRLEPWGSGVTLIALTGWGAQSDRQRAIEAGFDRHLTKPIDPDALLAMLTSGLDDRPR